MANDLAIRRSAAASKAWQTRRAQGWTHKGTHHPVDNRANANSDAVAQALSAFECEAKSDMPDWHRAALLLKQALGGAPGKVPGIKAPRPVALPPTRWSDYPVDKAGSFAIRTDILVVTFADGEVVRAPAVSIKSRPTNVGRGLRIAIAFYQARACWRRHIAFRPGVHAAVPEIVGCVCEDSGETFDAEECTMRTVEDRKAQDWRLKRGC